MHARGPAKDDSRSADIDDRVYIFTLLMVLYDFWRHKRLCKFLMKP